MQIGVRIDNFLKNRKVKQNGSFKSKLPFKKIRESISKLFDVEERKKRIQANINHYKASVKIQDDRIAELDKDDPDYDDKLAAIEQTKKYFEKKVAKYEEKLANLENANSDEVTVDVVDDLYTEYVAKNKKENGLSKEVLADYYDASAKAFKVGNKVISVEDLYNKDEKEQSKIYEDIVNSVEEMENNKYMKDVRKYELEGKALYGDAFIRDISALDDDLKAMGIFEVDRKVREVIKKNNISDKKFQKMDDEKLKKLLLNSEVSPVDLSVEHLKEVAENYKKAEEAMYNDLAKATKEKTNSEEKQEVNKQPEEQNKENTQIPLTNEAPVANNQTEKPEETKEETTSKEPESKISEEKLAEYNANKDEYTVNIEKAQNRIAEIDAKIQDYHNKHNSIIENRASAFATGFNVGMGDIIADNYDAYKESISDLEIEREKLLQDIKQNEESRRQERIEADKKLREERLNAINQKAKEVAEVKRAENARNILSHLETSTGFYDVSNLTDEEVLEAYDSIKAAPSMADRIAKAEESAKNDVKVTPEPVAQEQVQPQTVVAPLTTENNEQLANKANEQNQKITVLMNKYPGITEEQAQKMVQSNDANLQELLNNVTEQGQTNEQATEQEALSEEDKFDRDVAAYMKENPDATIGMAQDHVSAVNSLGTSNPTAGRSR